MGKGAKITFPIFFMLLSLDPRGVRVKSPGTLLPQSTRGIRERGVFRLTFQDDDERQKIKNGTRGRADGF
jgi:hypothetical protein